MRRWSIKFLVTLWSRLILLQPLLQHVWFRIWARPPRHFDEAGAKTSNFHPPTLPAPDPRRAPERRPMLAQLSAPPFLQYSILIVTVR